MQAGTIQSYIDKNAAINFVEHTHVLTADYFEGMARSTLALTGNPLPEQKARIEGMFPCPVRWQAPKSATIQPHPELAIIRDGMRSIYTQMVTINKSLKTLAVGATYREIANAHKQPNSYYSVYGSEAKDEMRAFVPMSSKLSELLAAAKSRSQDLDDIDIDLELGAEELTDLYAEAMGIQGRIGFKLERENRWRGSRLLYEDSHYNKTAEDFYEDFRSTGATHALILGMLPNELVEEMCPESELYRFQQTSGGSARMTDFSGYANGYIHDKEAWATLLSKPGFQGEEFNLVGEIVVRVGPFVICTLCKTMKAGKITRDLTLFREPYVKVVDLSQLKSSAVTAADLLLRRRVDERKCFLMTKEEYGMIESYAESLDEKALNLTTLTAMIRKRAGGAALIDKVFTKKWALREDQYMLVAAVVLLRVARDKALLAQAENCLQTEGFFSSVWRRWLAALGLPAWLQALVKDENMIDGLVVEHNPVLEQTVELREIKGGQMKFSLSAPKKQREEMLVGANQPDCKFCAERPWLKKDCKDDEQYMICGKDYTTTTIGLTTEEVETFRNKMLPDDTDAEGLREVKSAARKRMMTKGFQMQVEIVHLMGGPGCGKTHQIKKTLGAQDGLYIPFKKLLDDWQEDKDGNKPWVKTLHRGLIDARAMDTLYVDECSSVPYEFLVSVAYLCQAKKIILVGDFKQSGTTVAEGINISRRIDVEGAHRLVKNFRNNEGVIEWSNEKYDAGMERSSKTKPGSLYEFLPAGAEPPADMPHISPDRALVNIEETENTVRSYQGQNCDDLCITLTPESLRTWAVPCIKYVGLTRTKGKTYIRLVDGASQDAFKALVNKVEYAKKADRLKSRSKEANVGRFIVACLKYVEKRRLADLVRAFPAQIREAVEEERVRVQKAEEFQEREGDVDKVLAAAEEQVAPAADDETDEEEAVAQDGSVVDLVTEDEDEDDEGAFESSDDEDDDDAAGGATVAVPSAAAEDVEVIATRILMQEMAEDAEMAERIRVASVVYEEEEIAERRAAAQAWLDAGFEEPLTNEQPEFDQCVEDDDCEENSFVDDEEHAGSIPDLVSEVAESVVSEEEVRHFALEQMRMDRLIRSAEKKEREQQVVVTHCFCERNAPDCENCFAQPIPVAVTTVEEEVERVEVKEAEKAVEITVVEKNSVPLSIKNRFACLEVEEYADTMVEVLGGSVAAVALPVVGAVGVAGTLAGLAGSTAGTAVSAACTTTTVGCALVLSAARQLQVWRGKKTELEAHIEQQREEADRDEDAVLQRAIDDAQWQAQEIEREFWSKDGREQRKELEKQVAGGRTLTREAFKYALRKKAVEQVWHTVGTPCLRLPVDAADGAFVTKMADGVIETRLPNIPKAKGDQQGWEDKASNYVAQTLLVERQIELAVPELKAPAYRPTSDSFREAAEQDVYRANFGERMNTVHRAPAHEFTGQLTGDPIETRKNAKGNYKALRVVEKIGTGCNLTYNTDDSLGQYCTLATRYACPKKNYILDEEGKQLAREIALNAFNELVDRERLATEWQDVRAGTVYQGWLEKAKQAAYAASHDLFSEESDRIVRYHGKEIVKPKQEMTEAGIAKVGQGISAWSKGACEFFGAACRIVSQLELAVLKEEAVFNNGMSDDEAVRRFMKAAVKLPTFDGVTLDVAEMDSRVNEFIFEILKQFDLLLGVDSVFLELYYSMHADYTMLSEDAKMRLRWVMTSGAPWTLKGNTNTIAILECWLFRGDGPWARFWQGDDARRNQANLRVDRDRVERLKLYTGFQMSIVYSQFGDLCGFIFSHGQVVPSIRRKLCKIIGTEFRSLEHFQQYQISLRDWSNKLRSSLAYADAITINAQNNGVTEFTVENWLETIDSLGHISADQYTGLVQKLRKEYRFVRSSGHLDFV